MGDGSDSEHHTEAVGDGGDSEHHTEAVGDGSDSDVIVFPEKQGRKRQVTPPTPTTQWLLWQQEQQLRALQKQVI